jgi:formiminoglutamase
MVGKMKCIFVPGIKNDLLDVLSLRDGEEKVGEKVFVHQEIQDFRGRFALLGVREDVGPRANLGLGGACKGFDAFFVRFLNMQSNRFLSGEEVVYWGSINVENSEQEVDVLKMREFVEMIDDVLLSQLKEIYSRNLIPILIGGGHNNAFSLMKAYFQCTNKSMYVLNIDPHADFRALEGRHSGNSFSYAINDSYLGKYACLGLHESYNSESMLLRLEELGCWNSFFEDYLFKRRKLEDDLELLVNMYKEMPFGFDLDVDSMKFMPSSAFTPSGFSFEEARQMVHFVASNRRCSYFHLPEAAPLNQYDMKVSGKVMAYLVSDFIKAANLLF